MPSITRFSLSDYACPPSADYYTIAAFPPCRATPVARHIIYAMLIDADPRAFTASYSSFYYYYFAPYAMPLRFIRHWLAFRCLLRYAFAAAAAADVSSSCRCLPACCSGYAYAFLSFTFSPPLYFAFSLPYFRLPPADMLSSCRYFFDISRHWLRAFASVSMSPLAAFRHRFRLSLLSWLLMDG